MFIDGCCLQKQYLLQEPRSQVERRMKLWQVVPSHQHRSWFFVWLRGCLRHDLLQQRHQCMWRHLAAGAGAFGEDGRPAGPVPRIDQVQVSCSPQVGGSKCPTWADWGVKPQTENETSNNQDERGVGLGPRGWHDATWACLVLSTKKRNTSYSARICNMNSPPFPTSWIWQQSFVSSCEK